MLRRKREGAKTVSKLNFVKILQVVLKLTELLLADFHDQRNSEVHILLKKNDFF